MKRDADLFAENDSKETPCDCAEKQHHKELALSLESQMVFSTDPNAEDIEAEYAALDRREVSSLRIGQTLQVSVTKYAFDLGCRTLG